MASQAFRLRYRGKAETLTEDQVAPVHDKIRKALVKQFSADLKLTRFNSARFSRCVVCGKKSIGCNCSRA